MNNKIIRAFFPVTFRLIITFVLISSVLFSFTLSVLKTKQLQVYALEREKRKRESVRSASKKNKLNDL